MVSYCQNAVKCHPDTVWTKYYSPLRYCSHVLSVIVTYCLYNQWNKRSSRLQHYQMFLSVVNVTWNLIQIHLPLPKNISMYAFWECPTKPNLWFKLIKGLRLIKTSVYVNVTGYFLLIVFVVLKNEGCNIAHPLIATTKGFLLNLYYYYYYFKPVSSFKISADIWWLWGILVEI